MPQVQKLDQLDAMCVDKIGLRALAQSMRMKKAAVVRSEPY